MVQKEIKNEYCVKNPKAENNKRRKAGEKEKKQSDNKTGKNKR